MKNLPPFYRTMVCFVLLITFNTCEDGEEVVLIGPEVTFTSTPESGTAPLIVRFDATVVEGDGYITDREWDFGDKKDASDYWNKIGFQYTYEEPGEYKVKYTVTDENGLSDSFSKTIIVDEDTSEEDPDDPDDPPLFDGFQDITLSVGDYWEYSWTYDNKVNGDSDPTKSGIVRIELIDKVTNTFNVIGSLDLYETNYFIKSGDDYPLSWGSIPYFAFKEGVFYGASSTSGVGILFDFNKGIIYEKGFIGYFSSEREETMFESNGLVVVSEPFFQPECETIAGVEICGDEFHDYAVKEYYKPGIGFYGFYRSGTSIFSGGGYVDMFQSTMHVELSSTSLK